MLAKVKEELGLEVDIVAVFDSYGGVDLTNDYPNGDVVRVCCRHSWHPDDARADLFELVGLYVDPQAWNRGIGSRLYEAFEAKWLATDSATAVLEVWSENDRFMPGRAVAPRCCCRARLDAHR